MTEVIEGTAVEIVPAEVRAVAVVQQPGQVIVSDTANPERMVAEASRLATVLRDIIDRQRLYTVIQGKGYPHVEAWQTIGRLDNVVAREARPPVRNDDGSWEAFAELIRLSDGMVIGSASAMCGSPDDDPWGGSPAKNGKPARGPRPENARRSMAATRAISRAFRGQYAWIMVLAGYEPTPADEMPHEPAGATQTPAAVQGGATELTGKWAGTYATTDSADGQVRQEADHGHVLKFVIADVELRVFGRKRLNVRVFGPLAVAVGVALDTFGPPDEVIVEGIAREESFNKDGRAIAYAVCEATRVQTREWTVPAEGVALPVAVSESEKVNDLDNLPW